MKALATRNAEFPAAVVSQLAKASADNGEVNESDVNFKLPVIKGIQPRDQLETLLAAQMAIVHSLAVKIASSLNGSLPLPQVEIQGRLFNNLTRTFAMQMEALKRHRSTGEQKVTVEHVTVNEGGKAIVGNVTHEGRGLPEKLEPAI